MLLKKQNVLLKKQNDPNTPNFFHTAWPLPKQLFTLKFLGWNFCLVNKANQSLVFHHSRHVLAIGWDWVPSSTSSVSSDIRFARQSWSEPTNLSKRPVNAASSFYQLIYTTTHFTSAQWLGFHEGTKGVVSAEWWPARLETDALWRTEKGPPPAPGVPLGYCLKYLLTSSP